MRAGELTNALFLLAIALAQEKLLISVLQSRGAPVFVQKETMNAASRISHQWSDPDVTSDFDFDFNFFLCKDDCFTGPFN